MSSRIEIVDKCRVAIVGGGVSGLSAAIELARLGVDDVLVLERETEAGGAPRYVHNRSFGWREFRHPLPGPVFARRLEAKARRSARIITGAHVIKLNPNGELELATPDGLSRLSAERIILATGARETHRHGRLVTGARPFGIMAYGPLLRHLHFNGRLPFHRPVVIGSELVTLACLASLRQAGITPAALVEEYHRSTAPEVLASLAGLYYRVPVYRSTRVERINGRRRVAGVELNRQGERFDLECDGVVFTGRFVPEAHLVQRSHLSFDPGAFGPETDQFQRLSDGAYFACGNVMRAVHGSWLCSKEGERAASAVRDSLAENAPPVVSSVRIKTEHPVRFVWPQRIAPSEQPSPFTLKVAFTDPVSGKLRLTVDGRPRVESRVQTTPDRLVSLKIPGMPHRWQSSELHFLAD